MDNEKYESWFFNDQTNRYNFINRYTSNPYNPAIFTEYDWYTDYSTNEKIHYLLNDIILNRGKQHFFTIRNIHLQRICLVLDKDSEFKFSESTTNTSYDFTKNDNDLISFQQILSQNHSPQLTFLNEKEKDNFLTELAKKEKLFDNYNNYTGFNDVLDYFKYNLRQFISLLKVFYFGKRIAYTPENLAVIYYWGVEIFND